MIKIPQIGLGVWQIKNDIVPGVIEEAFKIGYRHIDTARIYNNEVGVGQAINRSKINRSDIFVTTKLFLSDILNPAKGLKNSLARLNLSYVDLYLIHWPFPFWQSAWKKLEPLYKDGLTRSIGVSNFNIKQLEELKNINGLIPAVNQIEISPFLYQKELINYCHSHGITVESYSPLTQGKRFDNTIITNIAQKYQKTYQQIMLRWGIQHDLVVLPRSTNPAHLKSNFQIFDFKINSDDMKTLDSLNDNYSAMFPGWSPK